VVKGTLAWRPTPNKACYSSTLRGQDLGVLVTTFRHVGTELAQAASYVVDSVTDPRGGTDGFHRLALAIAKWYQTIADERHVQ
jgi:hypothetical protein